ncbi:hypothetical protein BT69DRAFT_918012 [Atractiella rhizophila]|nr:hypothetical protein BT69DRAFT_918012 [Atractiella rhizophila]
MNNFFEGRSSGRTFPSKVKRCDWPGLRDNGSAAARMSATASPWCRFSSKAAIPRYPQGNPSKFWVGMTQSLLRRSFLGGLQFKSSSEGEGPSVCVALLFLFEVELRCS